MLNEKLVEVITSPPDGAMSIVTQGVNEPHVVNTWNSYISISPDDKLLIPVGGMRLTEQNISRDNNVLLSIANREVQGKMYKGAGFLIKGTARFVKEGSEFDTIKEKYPWARAILEVTIISTEQTV